MDHGITLGEKGSGITQNEEQSAFKFAQEALKEYSGNHLKMVQHIGEHMKSKHQGKWTILVIDSTTVAWEMEFYPVEDKHMEFTAQGHTFFVYKSGF